MKVVATIEARMNSSRLPGKVLLKAKNKSMLEILFERLNKVKNIDDIILATTINKKDDVIEDFCKFKNINCFRGSENDVMGRVLEAAKKAKADYIVEITADCPIIDPNIIEQVVSIFLSNNANYVSNANVRSYPDGMDVQVFPLDILEKSYKMVKTKLEREHVTLHIRRNPEIFSQINVIAPPDIFYPKLGLTLDEWDDYLLIKEIIDNLYEDKKFFGCLDIIEFLNKNKSLYSINKNVKRKGDL